MSKTLLVLSPGDWASSIEGRNAHGRLRASAALDVFDRLEYVFFRTTTAQRFHPESWLTVNEVSGIDGSGGLPFKLRSFAAGLKQAWEIGESVRPSCVVTADPFLTGALGINLARSLGVPFVLGLVSHYRQSWNIAGVRPSQALPVLPAFALQDWVLRNSDLILTHCNFYADYAVACGAERARVRVTPAWAESEFHDFEPDPGVLARHGIHDPAPVVYVGRLSPEKYSDDLLKSFARIRERQPERQLVVVGGTGPMREWFDAEVQRLGLSDAVHVLFADGSREVAAFMNAAGVLLAPHAGYAMTEAMLSGAAIVAYDFEWHGEMIEHGERGLLVPYRDWEAMADAALVVLEDPALRARFRSAARAFVENAHSQQAVIDGVAQAYRELLATGARRAGQNRRSGRE